MTCIGRFTQRIQNKCHITYLKREELTRDCIETSWIITKQLKLYNSQTLTDFVHISFFELLHQLKIQIFCDLGEHCHLLYIHAISLQIVAN